MQMPWQLLRFWAFICFSGFREMVVFRRITHWKFSPGAQTTAGNTDMITNKPENLKKK
jgi:hypothetical protein